MPPAPRCAGTVDEILARRAVSSSARLKRLQRQKVGGQPARSSRRRNRDAGGRQIMGDEFGSAETATSIGRGVRGRNVFKGALAASPAPRAYRALPAGASAAGLLDDGSHSARSSLRARRPASPAFGGRPGRHFGSGVNSTVVRCGLSRRWRRISVSKTARPRPAVLDLRERRTHERGVMACGSTARFAESAA